MEKKLTKPLEKLYLVKASGVHGKGVFANSDVARGTLIIEYKGQVIDWDTALERHPHDPAQPNHTFYFSLDTGQVIDANVRGNSARWINHSCAPNCEAREKDGRVFIHAKRKLKAGEELFYDYGLVLDEEYTEQTQRDYLCLCGSAKCRGMMLADKE
jgi:SET domain-containing protein